MVAGRKPMMSSSGSSGERDPVYLVTGSLGCIGSWTLRHLVRSGARTISFDLSDNRRRLDLLLRSEEQERITFVQGAITDYEALRDAIEQYGVTRIVHLAALQVPFCKAEPITGAQVNVVGTVNVFEAARQAGIRHLAFASSIAAFGGADGTEPATLYGVYKRANEGTARIYWQDHKVSSIGLRPYTVYGVGRDQGLTSEPTKAMLAAAAGKPYRIGFGGRMQFHYASDVALQFIEAAAVETGGAEVLNLGTSAVSVDEVVEIISRVKPGSRVSNEKKRLAFPEEFPAERLKEVLPGSNETPLEQGVRETIKQFEQLLRERRIEPPE